MQIENGHCVWRNENGQRHRIDGPAIECTNGDKYWIQNGQLHRTDGPAVKYGGGNKAWFLFGIKYTEEMHARMVKPGMLELV